MPEHHLHGTGWRPDPPGEEDAHSGHGEVAALLERTGVGAGKERPQAVDLRPWCSPVRFQGKYNTCTAHVVTGLLETLENRAHGTFVPASRLFLYQVTRRMLGESGDPGVFLRQMMGCLVLVGVPPEKYWPYLDTTIEDDPRLDLEPDAFCYAVAGDFRKVRPFRLDPPGRRPREVLEELRTLLAAGIPTSLGFPLYPRALAAAARDQGRLPLPAAPREKDVVGGHAVLVVGYDDALEIPRPTARGPGSRSTLGAFRIRNSWSTRWGEEGDGWLPYEYLLRGHARDCWTMLQDRWVDTGRFQLDWEEPGSPIPPAPG